MANRLIDTSVSMNASSTGGISIPLTATPALFGTLGLVTSSAAPDLRVQFNITVAVSSTLAVVAPITVTVVRIASGISTTIYTATETVPVGNLALSTTIISTSGIDWQPPNPGVLFYEAYISAPGLLLFPTRVGPENFICEAYSS